MTVAPLPTAIPVRIYPSKQGLTQDLSGNTLISILFNQDITWPSIVNNQSQIFVYLITAAILSTSSLLPLLILFFRPRRPHLGFASVYSLLVPKPRSPDATQPGTTWHDYIPASLVDTLAAETRAPQSALYPGVPDDVARAPALRINLGFSPSPSLTPVPAPGVRVVNGAGGNKSTWAGPDAAIASVVSALRGVAVLVWLMYRSWQRKKELAHWGGCEAGREGGSSIRIVWVE